MKENRKENRKDNFKERCKYGKEDLIENGKGGENWGYQRGQEKELKMLKNKGRKMEKRIVKKVGKEVSKEDEGKGGERDSGQEK